MSKLEKALKNWVDQKFITSEQVLHIFHDNYCSPFMAVPLFCFALFLAIKNLAGKNAMMRAFGAWTLFSGFLAIVVAKKLGEVGTEIPAPVLVSYLPAYGRGVLVVLGIFLNKQDKKASIIISVTPSGQAWMKDLLSGGGSWKMSPKAEEN